MVPKHWKMTSETLAEKASRIAQEARDKERSTRATNRKQMPLTAALIDDFEAVFGSKPPYGKFTETGPDGIERSIRWGCSPEERWTGPRPLGKEK